MWQAISGVFALVIVAMLNIGALFALGGPGENPASQVLTTALWALQAPLAAIFLNARKEKEDRQIAQDAGGENVFALSITSAIKIFVLMQIASFAFGGAIFWKDFLTRQLCATGSHPEACAQVAPDQLGASAFATLTGGGLIVVVVAIIACGVVGHRIGWRARKWRWIGAVLPAFLVMLLMLLENFISTLAFGGDIDPTISRSSWLMLLAARAPVFVAGMVAGFIGLALSLRVNRPARRYAFAIARASRRKTIPATAVKAEFLRVLGFSPDAYELNVRPKKAGGDAAADAETR